MKTRTIVGLLLAAILAAAWRPAAAATPAGAPADSPARPSAAPSDTAAVWAALLATTTAVGPAGEFASRLWEAGVEAFVRVRAGREGWWYEVLIGPATDRAALAALTDRARQAGIVSAPSAQGPPTARVVGEPFAEAAGLMRRGAVAGLAGRPAPAVADSLDPGAAPAAPPDTAGGR